MDYKIAQCGGLKFSAADFIVINGVITEATQPVDIYTPTYSPNVTADFDAEQYASKAGKNSIIFDAELVDANIVWTVESTPVELPHYGLTNVEGAIDGSSITVVYSEGSEPRTELIGDAFVAPMCGGLKFDDGVFENIVVDGKNVLTVLNAVAPTGYVRANCSLLFDNAYFEIGDDGELVLA